MVKMPTPMDRRRFLKHLGILGAAGVIGMGIGEIFSPTESDLIDAAADTEITERRKIIWKSINDVGDMDEGTTTDLKSGGFPIVNRAACAHHTEIDSYEDEEGNKVWAKFSSDNNYCKAPCVDVCPVDAIKIRTSTVDINRRLPGFTRKPESEDLDRDWGDPNEITGCIGCTKCFKMCGYDAIQWVNPEV